MVQIRKPVQPSENLIDLRVRRSPRGSIPLSAAAMLKRKKEDLANQMRAEALVQAMVLRRQRPR